MIYNFVQSQGSVFALSPPAGSPGRQPREDEGPAMEGTAVDGSPGQPAIARPGDLP